jgi:hypothetical protein
MVHIPVPPGRKGGYLDWSSISRRRASIFTCISFTVCFSFSVVALARAYSASTAASFARREALLCHPFANSFLASLGNHLFGNNGPILGRTTDRKQRTNGQYTSDQVLDISLPSVHMTLLSQ